MYIWNMLSHKKKQLKLKQVPWCRHREVYFSCAFHPGLGQLALEAPEPSWTVPQGLGPTF